ncbi:MAG TPA: PAS domain-containing protein [Ramlibacter sp.]|nr:PAS domain-containing protein [Ramlibacter sp.]
MAQRIRNHPWAGTSLGPIGSWPVSLRIVLDTVLASQAQTVLFWGPELLAFYNDAYAPTIGNKHPSALGRPAAEGWAELWDDLGPLLHSVLDTGTTVAARDRRFQIDRRGFLETVYFDISYSVVRDGDGDPAGVLCIVSETTERVLGAQRLADSEARLRQASERIALALNTGAVLGTWVWDVKADHFTADERFARTFAIDPEALQKGMRLQDVKQSIHRDDVDRVNRLLAAAMQKGGPYSAEYRVPRLDGGWRWIEANGHVELDDAGQPARFPGVLIDIDRRRAAEVTMRRSEARFRALAQALPAHVWTARQDGGVDWVNQRMLEYTGLRTGKLLDHGWITPIHPDDRPRTLDQWQASVSTGDDFSAEFRFRRYDGMWRWHLARAVCTGDSDDERWVGTMTDIDDQKSAQAALADLNAKLEQRVDERTHELQQALDRLSEARSENFAQER